MKDEIQIQLDPLPTGKDAFDCINPRERYLVWSKKFGLLVCKSIFKDGEVLFYPDYTVNEELDEDIPVKDITHYKHLW